MSKKLITIQHLFLLFLLFLLQFPLPFAFITTTTTTTKDRRRIGNHIIQIPPTSSTTKTANKNALFLYKPNLPNFCSDCGSSQMELRIPDGDDHLRAVCKDCGMVVYVNPKVVVACVILAKNDHQNDDDNTDNNNDDSSSSLKVLLAKRAIEPRAGYWGIPQGYMELNETTRQATCREVFEETGAIITEEMLQFRALYNVPGSVQLVYSVMLESENDLIISKTTKESTDIAFFPLKNNNDNDNNNNSNLPELCFPTVQWAIDHCRNTNSLSIQQKNKLYDTESGKWSESEDQDSPMIII